VLGPQGQRKVTPLLHGGAHEHGPRSLHPDVRAFTRTVGSGAAGTNAANTFSPWPDCRGVVRIGLRAGV